MPEGTLENKSTQTVFAFFVWQTDVIREITAREAEVFFRFMESGQPGASFGPLKSELSERYAKFWRDYLKQGPVPATELSLLTNRLDENLRTAISQLVMALHRAAPRSKRQKGAQLNAALQRLLVEKDANSLTELQRFFQMSRFYSRQSDTNTAEIYENPQTPEVASVPAVAAAGNPPPAAREPIPASRAEQPLTSETIPVIKLVPWSEHDAVNPERLQFWTKGSRPMRCIGIIERSPDFKSFQFMSEEPTLFFFKPGQFVTLELIIDGIRTLRSYTISSSPSRPHLIEISVKRVKGGLVSNYLHDRLNIGDAIMMKPPAGKFHCFDTTSDKYLFLAAGSGITPMLSMARWWHDTGAHPDVIFFHSVREPEDAVFTEDMISFTSANRNFRYTSSFTSLTLPESWPGMKGRFNEEKLRIIAPDFAERMVFTCGPDAFMKHVKQILERNGFSLKERFRQESFGVRPATEEKPAGAPAIPKQAATSSQPALTPVRELVRTATQLTVPAAVHFSLSGLEVFGGDMDIPLLELAEEVGVEIPSSCRAGTCGTCRAMKIRGEVECDETQGLTPADREAGFILTCVSRPRSFVELEV